MAVSSIEGTDDANLADPTSLTQLAEAAVDSDQDLLPVPLGHLVAGRYVLERILATGGMGIVCRATHIELEQRVAIKFLKPGLVQNAQLVARFLDEARSAAMLRSEHVVRVMDVGQLPSGVPYFVMEYLEGKNLETLVAREGPLRVERAIEYVLQACEALTEAHDAGIVHRDIKPENLFLIARGVRKELIKVVDFGIAKRLDASRAKVVTGPQENMGSPCYMSPEQMSAPRTVDARTDVWSLGVVLYQLLTGELPFDGDSIVEVFARVVHAPVRPLFEVRPDIDSHLDGIVRRCLEKNPSARFESVAALAAALAEYREGALLRTTPSLQTIPYVVRTRSDAPVAGPSRHGPAAGRGTTWVGGTLAAAALTAGVVAYHQHPSLARTAARLLSTPALGVTDASADAGHSPVDLVLEPFGVVSMDPDAPGYLQAEREIDAEQAARELDPAPGLAPREQKERSYRRFLSRHGWRPLRDVLEEMGETTGASASVPDPTSVPELGVRPAPSANPVSPADATSATPPGSPPKAAPDGPSEPARAAHAPDPSPGEAGPPRPRAE